MSSTPVPALLWATCKVFLGLSAASGAVAGIWWYGSHYDPEIPGKYQDSGRNYAMLPFDMTDAQNICQAKTKTRYGEILVRTQVDYHSTRYEEKSGLYKIFMSAHLGDNKIYDEATVYCFVNPDEYMIEHFRVVQTDQKSLMARAKSLFGL